jgi:serine/threonine protein phosphatase PrpC
MCSDGLNNMVSDSTIKEYVLSYSNKEAVEQLIKLANDNGGTDNITLQVINIEKNRRPEKTEPIPIVKTEGLISSFFRKLFKRGRSEPQGVAGGESEEP